MSGLLLSIFLQATAPPPAVPADWSVLAAVPWRAPPQVTPDITGFVATEVKANRCAATRADGQRSTLEVELAVMIRDDRVRNAVPRAIDCPTVEQFAAGLVSSFARNNLRAATAAGWYRTTLSFTW